MSKLAASASAAFAHPASIVAFPVLCGAFLAAGGGVDGLTLTLSVLAITTTQLVLLAQASDTAAVHAKLDGIVAGTDADDALAGIEKEGRHGEPGGP